MSNAEIINGAYEAFARGDGADLFSRLASDIEWTAPARSPRDLGGVYKGHEEVQSFFGKVLAAYGEHLAVQPETLVTDGDRVVALGAFHAQSDSGAAISLGFAHDWTVVDGKATRMVEYFDTARWAELLAG